MARKRTFSSRTNAGNSERARKNWAYFTYSGSQSQHSHDSLHLAHLWIQPFNKSASYRILGAFFTLKGGCRSGFYKNHLKIILVLDFIAWFKVLTFSHTFGNIGPGCSADCERAILERKTFEEELKCISEGVCQLVFITEHQYFNCPCTCRARHNRLSSNLLCFDNVPFTFCLQKCYSFFLCTVTNTHQSPMKLVRYSMLREVNLFLPQNWKRER